MKWLAFGAMLALFSGWLAGPASAQGFDCRKASHAAERAVCSSRNLSELDEELNALFFALPASVRNLGEVVAERETFLRLRNACGDDRSCIASEYFSFISYLRRF